MKERKFKEQEDTGKIREPFLVEKGITFVDATGWKLMTPKQKKKYAISTTIYFVLGILSSVYLAFITPVTEFFNKLASDATNPFTKGFYSSFPKIVSTLTLVILTIVILRIVNLIINSIHLKNQKARTITKLINSAIRYVAWIVALLLCLAFWGVNTAGILASAGIITLLCALPARTIADDLVAGIFIVFEGNLEVGDIVTYSGFKGTIREIGLRITKIENLNNDIDVIRNSEIKNIINNSVNTTKVIYKFDVPNKIKFDKVKATIDGISELPKEQNTDITTNLTFLGVTEISSSVSKYSVSFGCKEKRSLQSQRYIGELIKKTFENAGFYD